MPKSDLRKFAAQIADARDWLTVRSGIEAKLCTGPDGKETFVLVRSEERREKGLVDDLNTATKLRLKCSADIRH